MKLVQNQIIGAGNYLDDLYTRYELIKSGAFKESTLDGYVRKLVNQISQDAPTVATQQTKSEQPDLEEINRRLGNVANVGASKSDFSNPIKDVRFPLGFFKGITAYSTYQVFLICWLQNRLDKRENINILKQRLLRNEPDVIFNDDTNLNHPDILRFKEVLTLIGAYRNKENTNPPHNLPKPPKAVNAEVV